MSIPVSYIAIEHGLLAYRRIGRGRQTLVAFHGFGQDSTLFLPLEAAISSQFTVLAIDLFFHGQSQWSANRPLTKPDWATILQAVLAKECVDRFSLIGFSLGGRFVLSTVESFAHRIDRVMLVAPDGITVSFWYRVATRSAAGRWLFRRSLSHLPILSQFGHWLTVLNLLNRTLLRFAEGALGSVAQREQIYNSWLIFRLLQPDLDQISDQITVHSVPIHVFTGIYDRIVPPIYAEPLIHRLRQVQLTSFSVGHTHLIGQVVERLGAETARKD